MWSFDLRLPWYLVCMNPYFSSYSIMTLSHARGDTGYGELHMEVMSRSTRNRSTLVRGDCIQLIIDRMMIREIFDQSMNIRNSF